MSMLSLIVPTRERSHHLRGLLDSLAKTATRRERLEIVLVVDADDPASRAVQYPGLRIRHVIVPPGQRMGSLNMAGFEASSGEYCMLLNDDVRASTRGWDERLLACFGWFADPMVLAHVNDGVFGDALCTFPVVSRTYCEIAGGICPREYRRYRIDDHIEDVFNLLTAAGVCRTIYLPDVLFTHLNTGDPGQGHNGYEPEPQALAHDAPLFESLFIERKALAARLLGRIYNGSVQELQTALERLDSITPFHDLRSPRRQWVQRGKRPPQRVQPGVGIPIWQRIGRCARERGLAGVVQAVRRRVWRF